MPKLQLFNNNIVTEKTKVDNICNWEHYDHRNPKAMKLITKHSEDLF